MGKQPCFDEGSELKERFRLKADMFDTWRNIPYEAKLTWTRRYVKDAIAQHGKKIIVACSFGKDSTAIVHLAIQEDPDVLVVFANTGVEFRETIQFKKELVEEWDLNYEEAKPETTFWKLVDKHGYPFIRYWSKKMPKNVSSGEPRCCYHLKKKPMNKIVKALDIDAIMLGLTFDESYQRRYSAIRFGQTYITDKSMPKPIVKFHPILYWTTEEVWRYTRENSLPVNEAYEKYGIPRIGCRPCTGYLNWQKEMPKHSFKLYQKVATDLGMPPLETFT